MRYDFLPARRAWSGHEVKTLEIIGAIFFMLVWYAFITLPGTFLIHFLWKPTRRVEPIPFRHFVQSALIAVAYAPVIYGHAGPLPAVVALIANDPMFRIQVMVSLALVFVISLAVLTILALRKNQRPP